MRNMVLAVLWSALLLLFCGSHGLANDTTYVTWEGMEPDKIASIWLLTRFVDPGATIHVIPKGGVWKKNEIAFDVPGATLRRYHTRSTFETILDHYQVKDEKLHYIGKLIHDIEINSWGEKRFPETEKTAGDIWQIINTNNEQDEVIEKAGRYLDSVYSSETSIKKCEFPENK